MTVQRGSTSADVTAADFDGFDAVVHLAALSNDPIGDLERAVDVRHQSRCESSCCPSGQGSRCRAIHLRFFVLDVRRRSGSDDLLDEGAPLRPLTAYAEIQGACRGGSCRRSAATGSRSSRCETRRSTVSRPATSRHRPQQPRWVGPPTGESSTVVRRAVMAAARARSRSVPNGPRDARGAGSGRRRRGVQRRLGRPELPRAGPRGSTRRRHWM